MELEVKINESEVREAVNNFLRTKLGRDYGVSGVTLSVGSDGKIAASARANPIQHLSGGKD